MLHIFKKLYNLCKYIFSDTYIHMYCWVSSIYVGFTGFDWDAIIIVTGWIGGEVAEYNGISFGDYSISSGSGVTFCDVTFSCCMDVLSLNRPNKPTHVGRYYILASTKDITREVGGPVLSKLIHQNYSWPPDFTWLILKQIKFYFNWCTQTYVTSNNK